MNDDAIMTIVETLETDLSDLGCDIEVSYDNDRKMYFEGNYTYVVVKFITEEVGLETTVYFDEYVKVDCDMSGRIGMQDYADYIKQVQVAARECRNILEVINARDGISA